MIDSLCLDDRLAPMLDWTSLELARLLPERTLFGRSSRPRRRFRIYRRRSRSCSSTTRAAWTKRRAWRPARRCWLQPTPPDRAIAAETRHMRSASGPVPEPVLIVVPADADNEWVGRLAEAVALRPGVEVLGATDPIAAAAESAAATVVVAEHGVLPLPRCIEAAERILEAHDDVGGVAVKLFGADGSLEAAGAAAFADGSVEAIASGGPPAGAWHEYVRPVAAAVGLVVLRSKALRECADAGEGAFDLTGLSAHLWSNGWELRYQPDAAAVRVLAPAETAARIWPQAPDGLPARPRELDDASWRRLLAQRRGGGRPMSTRRVLVSQPRFPEIDRDTGSQRIDLFMRWLLERGWSVTFMATGEDSEPRNAHRLQQLGIPTYFGSTRRRRLSPTRSSTSRCWRSGEPASRLLPDPARGVARDPRGGRLDRRALPARSAAAHPRRRGTARRRASAPASPLR